MSRTALYRHFDSAGRLLYVGISLSFASRLADHSKTSHWSADIARADVEYFPTREEALAAERAAIQTENPLHNKKHARTTPPPPPVVAATVAPIIKRTPAPDNAGAKFLRINGLGARYVNVDDALAAPTFPAAVHLGGRDRFWRLDELEQWDRAMIERGAATLHGVAVRS